MVGCGSVEDGAEPVSTVQAKLDAAACTPESPGIPIAPGVTYYDCHSSEPAVHIITVDRSLPATEIQLIADRRSGDPAGTVRLKRVRDLAIGIDALAAVNGFTWHGPPFGTQLEVGKPARPESTTFLFDEQLTSNSLPANEALMGFVRGGPEGIQAKHIEHPLGDDTEFNRAVNLPYRYQMYGSTSSVLIGGMCQETGTQTDHWSVVGYSPTSVVLLATATGKEYLHQEFCPTLKAFRVTDAIRNDGGPSASMYVGGPLDKLVNPLSGFMDTSLYGDSRNVAYGLGIVSRAAETRCNRIMDASGVAFASLCITPENTGYLAEVFFLNDSRGRCGTFQFKLVSTDGRAIEDEPPFDDCFGGMYFARPFDVGTLGGCATLHLLEVSGADFGRKEWTMPACGDAGGPGGGPDTTPPSTTVTPSTLANANGWNNTDVTLVFAAVDTGAAAPVARALASEVRAIHVLLRGAQTDNIVVPGGNGSVTISTEGTTHVTYFAVDNAGNAEPSQTLTIRIDKTPPEISGMVGPNCLLWPPNHKMVAVATITASDGRSGPAAFDVDVTSNEPANNKEPDFTVSGEGLQPRVVALRAERLGQGDGRVYSIAATASDVADNVAHATGMCTVPHDQGN
jgi:hypothetical protein